MTAGSTNTSARGIMAVCQLAGCVTVNPIARMGMTKTGAQSSYNVFTIG